MSRINRSSRATVPSLAALGWVGVLVLAASNIATQSRIIPPQLPASSNSNTNRQPVATLRANDSAEGSRATLSADQSLSDYEAYRRGDRFYVKIPPADVPRPDAVRGRAFFDVKVQRTADSTVLSFRLQPGATAHVEQRDNKLDVVFTMPGGGQPTSPSTRDVARNDVVAAPPSTPEPGLSPKSSASPSPTPTSTASKGPPMVGQQHGSPANPPTVQGDTWANFKQRMRYWILLAQLNPIPVAIGVAVLLFFIGLLVFQRRRAKSTRRVRLRVTPKIIEPVVERRAPAVAAKTVKPAEATGGLAAAAATEAVSASVSEPRSEASVANERQERVAHVSDEVRKLMAGGDYDENIVASDNRETRQLVAAELLSALVGRNLQRRERARAAFMKHGYFDDATRDLRTAESPNERAAAARRLSFVRDREATPHLIAALDDSSPDVRRASVEALMDLRDPAAIAPLNSLMQTESDRKIPRSLIKHAIETCAASSDDNSVTMPAVSSPTQAAPAPRPPQPETEREVIEI